MSAASQTADGYDFGPATAAVEAAIARSVAAWPAPTDEQRARLAFLLGEVTPTAPRAVDAA